VKGQRRELLTSYEQKLDGMDKNEVARQAVLDKAAAAPRVPVVRACGAYARRSRVWRDARAWCGG
jgi:hypothetical protein